MESPEYIFFYNQFIVLRLEDGTVSLILNVHFCSKVWGWSDFLIFCSPRQHLFEQNIVHTVIL